MRIALHQIDAFTDTIFSGNPAAVCPLPRWLGDDVMQAIAAENNLSETAFVVSRAGGTWELRWFTPTTEVDLCGHATLAAAWQILRHGPQLDTIRFETRSGPLTVQRADHGALTMDFPAIPPDAAASIEGLADALGAPPEGIFSIRNVHNARYVMAVFPTADAVAALAPDITALGSDLGVNVIVTAPGQGDVDFVSRFFAPASGVAEDPVTGSAHCTLAPYWAERLGKTVLNARQLSARGGALICGVVGDRVQLTGHCALYLDGTINLPG
ncbi:MAG: PhzF family phenazine biosynthesis protein [Myxococcota bacterium]